MTAILEIVKQHLKKIKPSGSENLMAICPFHRKADGSEEQDGSFAINQYNGLWFCHSCHSKGNLYTFLRAVGLPHSSITTLYQYAIDAAEQHTPNQSRPLNTIAPTHEVIQESFLGLFNYYPQLMADEGFPPELCQAFGVGFDELHQRVTFPLRDLSGQLVGISGRAVGAAKPRYKVYDKEYLDFGLAERETQKRAILWNAHEAAVGVVRQERAKRFVVVVEGFKGAMRVAQAGISTVVATLGSYLSKEQQWFLESAEADIYLMPDNDQPGIDGCIKTAHQLVSHVRSLRVVDYDKAQPSDLTPEEVLSALTTAAPYAVWLQKYLA